MFDIVVSWTRMLIALILSILFSLAIGIMAARNKKAEAIIIPVLDVFQSIPILGFFPLVILGIIAVFPSQIGVNLAVIFLIFTSMSWNIAFGVYEAVKSIPQDYIDLSQISESGSWRRITSLYIPASLSRVAYNTQTSWAVGLFYLVSSEILTLGSKNYSSAYGIGVRIIQYADSGDWTGYTYAIISLIIAVIIWQFVFLREFALWSEKYKFVEEPREVHKDAIMRVYSWVNQKSISKLFLMTQGKGVTKFTSSLSRFRRGMKYSVPIVFLIFIALEFSALMNLPTDLKSLPSISFILRDESRVLTALAYSFVRVWYVYFICVAVGLPLGIVVALNAKLYNTLAPVIEVIASVPAPILLPVLVLYFNHNGEAVAALIIFLGMIWYIIFNVMAGVRSLPKELFELRKEFQISTLQTWRDIYLPATFTAFVTGSITAIGAAWNTLIVAEYFNPGGTGPPTTQVSLGIGKTISVATVSVPADLLTVTLAILSMTALIVIFNLTVWRRIYHYTTKRYAYNR
ncbi:MAG: ABC transporter permease subunit [Nitrososphaerales archaeon]